MRTHPLQRTLFSAVLILLVTLLPMRVTSAERFVMAYPGGVPPAATKLQVPASFFLPAVTYNSGGSANSVAVGDFNGDGKPDLAVANICACNTGVAVLLGNGDGTFQPAVTYNSGGAFADSIAIADVDGDGKPDLVVANECGTFSNNTCVGSGESSIGVLLGNGDGTFQAPKAFFSGGSFVQAVVLADVNSDGRPDVVAVNACAFALASKCSTTLQDGTVSVFLNSGLGYFTMAGKFDSGGLVPTSVAVADLKGNGKLDLAVTNSASSSTAILMGNGAGFFGKAIIYPEAGSGVTLADVNGDGKPDLLVAGTGAGVLLNNGDGTFRPAVHYSSGGVQPTSIVAADVNGDGTPDLLLANSGSGTAGLLLGNGDGTFQPAQTYSSGGSYDYSLAVADVNGDGRPDLLVANASGSIGVLLNKAVQQAPPSVFVTNSSSSSVSEINTTSNTVTATVTVGNRPIGVVFTPDGSRVYVANSGSNSVSVINTATNTVITTIPVASFPQGVAITPDGSHVYTANSGSNTVAVIDTSSNTVTATINVGLGAAGVAVTPDGSRAYVTNNGTTTVSVIETASNTVNATISVGLAPVGVAITPDGSRAYVANNLGGSVSVIDTASNTVIDTVGMAQPVAVAVTPDGSRAYVTTNLIGQVSVIDTSTNTVIATIGVGSNAQGVAITPDGAHSYVACFGTNSVFVIDTSTNTVTDTIKVGSSPVGVAIAPPVSPTTLTSTLNPSIYGQKLTLTATVTPSGTVTPTGKVKFTWDRFTIGSADLNASGVATLTRSNLNADTYPFVAVYPGDSNNAASTSAVLNQVVLPTTSSATLASSPNPSTAGQAVTFTAKISSPTVTPTGPVTFTAGKTVLGTVQLASGKATLTISSLPVGSTWVKVTFNGDSNIAKSSASVTQVVH